MQWPCLEGGLLHTYIMYKHCPAVGWYWSLGMFWEVVPNQQCLDDLWLLAVRTLKLLSTKAQIRIELLANLGTWPPKKKRIFETG